MLDCGTILYRRNDMAYLISSKFGNAIEIHFLAVKFALE